MSPLIPVRLFYKTDYPEVVVSPLAEGDAA